MQGAHTDLTVRLNTIRSWDGASEPVLRVNCSTRSIMACEQNGPNDVRGLNTGAYPDGRFLFHGSSEGPTDDQTCLPIWSLCSPSGHQRGEGGYGVIRQSSMRRSCLPVSEAGNLSSTLFRKSFLLPTRRYGWPKPYFSIVNGELSSQYSCALYPGGKRQRATQGPLSRDTCCVINRFMTAFFSDLLV